MSDTMDAKPGDADAKGLDEGQVREIAYFLWIEEGCPDGRAEAHWMMACAKLGGPPATPAAAEAEAPAKP